MKSMETKINTANTKESPKPVLSKQDLELIRETARLTENLYVKMIYDKLAMDKILNLL